MREGMKKNLYLKEFHGFLEASEWATSYCKKEISISNISYLVSYGRVKNNGTKSRPIIFRDDLKEYFDKQHTDFKSAQKSNGKHINWNLSFKEYREFERTKHVHRLHPYKGKFIPQLVEYFLDNHTDDFKKKVFFGKGDIVLDPFCGSGTTLIQANELGINGIGIDISQFNKIICEVKVGEHDLLELSRILSDLSKKLSEFQKNRQNILFEEKLQKVLYGYNSKYFPSPEYRYRVRSGQIDEKSYTKKIESQVIYDFDKLVADESFEVKQKSDDSFMGRWYSKPVREEIEFLKGEINKVSDEKIRHVLMVILSRTTRSCRATTHSDLGTLVKPTLKPYYCKKHGRICKPLFSIEKWWRRYSSDTLRRLSEFDKLKTGAWEVCIHGDSRKTSTTRELEKSNPKFAEMLKREGISGIFSSPPYVGLIDYHEQHAYAYELFGLKRNDNSEIGPLFEGQGEKAKTSYVSSISTVLLNFIPYMKKDFNIFLVANDKYNLYPKIAEKAGLKIVDRYERPVLNRVEKNRGFYSETIFHMKEI